jgi:hypothetical protein
MITARMFATTTTMTIETTTYNAYSIVVRKETRDRCHRPVDQTPFFAIRKRQYTLELSLYLKMEDDEQLIRNELSRDYLHITEEESYMFDNIYSFLALSRDNDRVTMVALYPFDNSDLWIYEFWDKMGQIVGNLTELQMIRIYFHPYNVNDNDGGDRARIPAWGKMTRILTYLRRKLSLFIPAEDYDAEVEDIQGLARVIHGHPMISGFLSTGGGLTFRNLGTWCSTLVTLPSLERVRFGSSGARNRGPTAFAKPRAF